MNQRKKIANVIGLAGCVTVAYGLHGLMLTANCGGPTRPECPPESTPLFVAVTVGLMVAIISAVAGGRLAILGLFLAVGAGSLWAGFDAPPDQRLFPLLFGGSFIAVPLLPLLFLPFIARKRRRAMRVVTEGVAAIGTVTAIRDTGTTVNNNPRVELALRIEPQDGSSIFEGTKTITASRVDLPYRGQRFPVWYDRDDRTVFVLATNVDETASPDVRRLFALAEAGNPSRPGDAAGAAATDPLDRLAKLNELRLSGALTEAEFETQKAKLLDSH